MTKPYNIHEIRSKLKVGETFTFIEQDLNNEFIVGVVREDSSEFLNLNQNELLLLHKVIVDEIIKIGVNK